MKLFLFAITCMLTACVSKVSDPRLEGTWTSNKERTLSNIKNVNLTREQVKFLIENLGDMQHVYRGNRAAIAFLEYSDEPLKFERFSVLASKAESVTVQTRNGELVQLNFVENCFYILTDWEFNEYFCKAG